MGLNLVKLENVRRLTNGGVEARCPACAEGGRDRKGEHLMIKPDGRFGCCAYPKDGEHRKRIFALAGDNSTRPIEVRPARVKVAQPVTSGILGRLGRVFPSRPKVAEFPDASDGVNEVGPALEETRTPRTGCNNSDQSVEDNSRTLRTPQYSSTYGEKISTIYVQRVSVGASVASELSPVRDDIEKGVRGVRDAQEVQTELEGGVRAVRAAEDWRRRHPTAPIDENGRPLPYVRSSGTLIIPFDSDERFHYWKGRQSLALTREEAISRKDDHGTGV